MDIIVWLIVWIFIGCLVGAAKDQLLSGLIWSLLLGPLGVLIVVCLPNRKKQKAEAERKKQSAIQLQLQQAQLRKLEQMRQLEQMQYASPPPPPGHEPKLRIASNGKDLGEMPVATVKTMLKTGKLTQQDYYFDRDANDWMPLDCCPTLV
jgi:hypothetical protein